MSDLHTLLQPSQRELPDYAGNRRRLLIGTCVGLLATVAAATSYMAFDTYQRRATFERFCDAKAYELSVACAAMR